MPLYCTSDPIITMACNSSHYDSPAIVTSWLHCEVEVTNFWITCTSSRNGTYQFHTVVTMINSSCRITAMFKTWAAFDDNVFTFCSLSGQGAISDILSTSSSVQFCAVPIDAIFFVQKPLCLWTDGWTELAYSGMWRNNPLFLNLCPSFTRHNYPNWTIH